MLTVRQRLWHAFGRCPKQLGGYTCHGTQPLECGWPMSVQEIDARQAEVDAFSDWLTDHGAENYLDYAHRRGAQLDDLRDPHPRD